MQVVTPLGEYPFEFRRLGRRPGGLVIRGTVAGLESSVVLDAGDLRAAGRRLGPPLIAIALLVYLRRAARQMLL
ncbi:MAG: hypothetical protein H0X42_04285 [Solirubrobacterales bacterium]|nr:hypothetical protein [Solirubrobacterales bacterium]